MAAGMRRYQSHDTCSSRARRAKGRPGRGKEFKLSNGFVVIPLGSPSNAHAVRVPKTAELVAKQIRNAIIRGELRDGVRCRPNPT